MRRAGQRRAAPRGRSTLSLFFLAFGSLVAVLCLVFTLWLYIVQRASLLAGIDGKLAAVAMMARDLLPPDYHDRIRGPDSVSGPEYLAIVERNDRLCLGLGLEYIWSLIELDGKIYFTTASSPDKVAANGRQAGFLELHSNPELYRGAFASMKPTFQVNEDKWGRIRVALLPFRDASGRSYLFGASERLSVVENALAAMLRGCVIGGAALLLLGMLLAWQLSRTISRPLRRLSAVIRGIASGEGGLVAAIEGTREQADLAHSFNRMSAALRAGLEEKEVLLREVHHRVKNNLNVISSLVNLQSTSITGPEEALGAFANIRDRIMAMALVHEELYRSEDHARVDMADYIDALLPQIARVHCSRGHIRVEAHAEGVTVKIDAAIPCAIILNELIVNAYRHAFPDGRGGKIGVSMRELGEGDIELCVSDDGIGMPEASGCEGSGAPGLLLVSLLAEQLDGRLDISSGTGTVCRILFPQRA